MQDLILPDGYTPLAMIAVGFIIRLAAKAEKVKHYGTMLTGLGLVFFGMVLMSDALYPLRSYPPFIDFMISMENPLLGAAIGAGFTAIVQSSSATTGILIVMASQGLIGIETAIAIALGANVGVSVHTGRYDDADEHTLTIAALDGRVTRGAVELQGEAAFVRARC